MRATWGVHSTVRTADGSTVALPGVSDAAAVDLERFRASIAERSLRR